MMLNSFLLLSLLIWLSGDAAAQYQRTPAGENIDVRVLSRTRGRPNSSAMSRQFPQ
jgi:hypothetical protein